MKNKKGWRKGFGLAQIMALMLVVLPTMAFIIMFLLDYWAVMQADYRLKIIANKTAEFYNNIDDASNYDTTSLKKSLKSLCPGSNSTFTLTDTVGTASDTDDVSITITYTHNGTYIKNKVITTGMKTYSYHDINSTVTGSCVPATS